jgi:transketolase
MTLDQSKDELLKIGLSKLLKIKDSDIRIATLKQGYEAVDHGIHMGGAFSATIPIVSLFYGGFMNLDIEDPTRIGQDMFVLSKGHAVATMASVYADLGYFDPSLLVNSRSVDSILNGHPGPLLPGVHISTGPLGQGLAVAQGFAMAGKRDPEFNVFCITGDGELQEGVVWEAFMHAPQRWLDNLCVLVDKNEGQLDNSAQLIFSMDNLPKQIESFGWRMLNIDGTSYSAVVDALETFVRLPRDGRPMAIVCNTKKGFGAFSFGLNKHKVTLAQDVYEQEMVLQRVRRKARVEEYREFQVRLIAAGREDIAASLRERAKVMNLSIDSGAKQIVSTSRKPRSGRVPERDKTIAYGPEALPSYEADAQVSASDVVKSCMSVFARDLRVVSVDADLGTTSGLEAGIGAVDQQRAINVGVAESNMMCVGEAYAALGYNAWVSTFCPFFDWKVLRRIAVGAQERVESMEASDGWLSKGHGLDLTFLATASNFDTKVNGATHMGNDDIIVYGGIAGLKIIDVSCPNQLVSIMRWIMDGNRGLNYVRIMRAASGVLYAPGVEFAFGKAYRLHGSEKSEVNFVSSGRGVHEVLAAAKILEEKGITVSVYDMPSFDQEAMIDLLGQDALTVVAEQNNGFIWQEIGQMMLRAGVSLEKCLAINVNNPDGSYQYLHSATYEQLLSRFGLEPGQMAAAALRRLQKKK